MRKRRSIFLYNMSSAPLLEPAYHPVPQSIGRNARSPRVRWRKAALERPGASTRGMIRRLRSGEYRLLSRKKDTATGRRRNLGTFKTLEQAKQRERELRSSSSLHNASLNASNVALSPEKQTGTGDSASKHAGAG
jgi:hypothetical protein